MNDSDFEPGHRLEDAAWAYARKDYNALTKASIGRLFHHFKQSSRRDFAILSAWQSDRGEREHVSVEEGRKRNEAAMGALKQHIRSKGLGYVDMHGVGQHEGGAVSHVYALFVPGVTPGHAIQLGRRHGQDAIIFAGPETEGKVHLHEIATGKTLQRWDTFQPEAVSTYFSGIGGKRSGQTFTLGSSQTPGPSLRPSTLKSFLHYHVGSWGEGVALQSYIRRAREYLEPV